MTQNVTFILKLLTGEEIIAKVTGEENDALFLERPLQIYHMPDEKTGKMSMGLMDFMPYAEDGSFAIPRTGIAVISLPKESLLNQYKEITGDIIIPSNRVQIATL